MRSVILVCALALAACGGGEQSPESAEAERLWRILDSDPSTANFEAFKAANLRAALKHGELHDSLGVQFQVRAYEAQAGEALRTKEPDEASRIAFEVIDGIEDLERRGLLGVYEELLPGATERLSAAKGRAAGATR